ncbi:MAG TPA: SDR family oxidoreductase, partial [Mycobacterium sp.]|nr:SDR family oxidoreductase [Mycobacterium sp.]
MGSGSDGRPAGPPTAYCGSYTRSTRFDQGLYPVRAEAPAATPADMPSGWGEARLGLTRNLATEGLEQGIRVNALAPRAYTRMSASQVDALSEFFAMPKDVMYEINASMPPDLSAPAAAFLAHESCALNGEVLQVGMGGVARIAVVRAQGISKQPLTAEDIAENLDQIMDL